jgi:hypothetical protein
VPNVLERPQRTILGWAKLAANHSCARAPEDMVLHIARVILLSDLSRTAMAVIAALRAHGRPGEVVNDYVDDACLLRIDSDARWRGAFHLPESTVHELLPMLR